MVKKHILDLENFKHILTAFGDKLTEEDMDDIFGEFEYDDDGNIFTKVMTMKKFKETSLTLKRPGYFKKPPQILYRFITQKGLTQKKI